MTYSSRKAKISFGFGRSKSLGPSSAASARRSSMISLHSSTHSSQMYTPGPAISCCTCFWLFPQKEHLSRSALSPIRAMLGLLLVSAPGVLEHPPENVAATSVSTVRRVLSLTRVGDRARTAVKYVTARLNLRFRLLVRTGAAGDDT